MKTGSIVLGGGCFWCSEAIMRRLKGVLSATPGYAGGSKPRPTYEEVCSGRTGHAEVVRLEYDPAVAKLETLLELFFAMHDPASKGRQGNDEGSQYRSIILYSSPAQKKAVEAFMEKIAGEYDKPLVTELKKLHAFYPAEAYHKDYYENNRYQPYCALVISPKLRKLREKYGLI